MTRLNTVVLLILLSFVGIPSYCQFGPRNVINDNSGTLRILRAADFDQDGDIDIVTASFDLIAWYENLDGQGTFGLPITIQEGKKASYSLFPGDIDRDGMMDLVVSFLDDDEVVWYRNLGGGEFSKLQQIATDLMNAGGVTVADLDSDGDLDIVMGVTNNSGLYWAENLDGLGNFGARIIISSTISQARTQSVGDIDGDGDLDIVSNSSGAYYLSWFENIDGFGDFSNQYIIDPVGLYENSLHLTDIDGDGDLDIVSQKSDAIIWRENLDGLGTYSAYSIISTKVAVVFDTAVGDLTNNGAIDVVSASTDDNKIAWYKNEDGEGSFGAQQIIDPILQSPRTVHAADIDGDGDLDVISAALSNDGRELVWYENLTILGIEENNYDTSIIYYPNPVVAILNIQNNGAFITGIEIFNLQGSVVFSSQEVSEKINVSHLKAGVYFIKTTTENGTFYSKIVKK